MTISFSCENCGKTLSTSDEKIGKKARCPGCGTILQVPGSVTTANASELGLEDDGGLEVDDDDIATSPKRRRQRSTPSACPMCGEAVTSQDKSCPTCGETLSRNSRGGIGTDGKADFGEAVQFSWEHMKRDPASMIVPFVIFMAINFGVTIPRSILDALSDLLAQKQNNEAVAALIPVGVVVLSVLEYVLRTYTTAGMWLYWTQLARGERPGFQVLFSGGRYIWRLFLVDLVGGLMFGGFLIVVCGLIALVFAAIGQLMSVGVWVCIGVGMLLALAFWSVWWMTPLYVIDREARPTEAITMSIAGGSRNFSAFLALMVLNFVLGFLGILMCCIGILATMPIGLLAGTVMYLQITNQHFTNEPFADD